MTITEVLSMFEEKVELKSMADVMQQVSALNREILIEDVDEDSASAVELIIRFWNDCDKDIPVEERKPIKVYINSYGGVISGGLAIIDSITMSKTPVYTIVIGAAYSMGLEIAITGHKRFCYKNATYVFHEGSISSMSMDANKFKNFADFYKRQLQKNKANLLSHTNITEEWYKEHQNDDVWIFAEEALELGLVDVITEEFI